MSLGSTAAKNADLDACYGAGKAAGWPATVYLALFTGDPTGSGTELTSAGGYARVAVTNNGTNFGAASAGAKSNATAVTLPVSTAAYSGAATYWAWMDAATGGNLLDTGALTASTTVTASGQQITFPPGALVVAIP